LSDELQLEEARWLQLKEALSKLQTLAAAGQFAASVMHEINNPLEAISNLTYLANSHADDPGKVREYTHLIGEQLTNVLQIANQTLGYYRPTNALETVDVVTVVEAALRVHQRKISAKKVRLLKHLPGKATVRVHAGEMLQVISNLVENALDALPENGTLCLRVRRGRQDLHLIVADDGHGIPSTVLPKVFDPFFTTKMEEGTGLGLAISKTIVERHRGKIRTRSSIRPGRSGTAFRITLPLDNAI
jgi:signal transduction histidine kinase